MSDDADAIVPSGAGGSADVHQSNDATPASSLLRRQRDDREEDQASDEEQQDHDEDANDEGQIENENENENENESENEQDSPPPPRDHDDYNNYHDYNDYNDHGARTNSLALLQSTTAADAHRHDGENGSRNEQTTANGTMLLHEAANNLQENPHLEGSYSPLAAATASSSLWIARDDTDFREEKQPTGGSTNQETDALEQGRNTERQQDPRQEAFVRVAKDASTVSSQEPTSKRPATLAPSQQDASQTAVPLEGTQGCTDGDDNKSEDYDVETPSLSRGGNETHLEATADHRTNEDCDSNSNNEDNNANDVEAPLRSSSGSSLVANGSSTAQENHSPSPDGLPCPISPISKLLHEGHDKVMKILHNNQSDSSSSQPDPFPNTPSDSSVPEQDPFQMRFRDLLCIADVVAKVNKRRLNDKHNQLCDRPQNLSPEDKKRLRDILMAGLKVADKLIDLVPPSNRQLDIFLSQPAEENEPGGYNEGLLKTLSMNVFFDRISVQAATLVQPPLEILPHVLTSRIVVSILTFDSVRMKGPLAGFLCGFARQQRHSQQQPIPFIIDAMPGAAWIASRNSTGKNIKEAQWVEDLKLLLPLDEPWPAVVVMKNFDKRGHQNLVAKEVKNALTARQSCQPRTRVYILVVVAFLLVLASIVIFLVLRGNDDGSVNPPASPSSQCLAGPFLRLSNGLTLNRSNAAAPRLEEGSRAFACSSTLSGQSRVVYYQLRGDGNCYTVNSEGSTFDTVLGVLVGTACDATQCLASNVDMGSDNPPSSAITKTGGFQVSTLFLDLELDQEYWLVVGGVGGSVGEYLVQFTGSSCAPSASPTISNPVTWHQLGMGVEGEAAGDESGISVELSSDGYMVAIGAPTNGCCGHVRVFQYDTSTTHWNQQGQSIHGEAPGDAFGSSVALSANGLILAVGGHENNSKGSHAGHVRVFALDPSKTHWNQLGQDLDGEAANDLFGSSVDLSADGLVVAIGAPFSSGNRRPHSGYFRVFAFNVGTFRWIQQGQELRGEVPWALLGVAVALSSDGMIVAASARGYDKNDIVSGNVYIYAYDTTAAHWNQLGQNIAGEAADDQSGSAVGLSSDGRIVAVGAHFNAGVNGPESGHVRVWTLPPGSSTWMQMGQDLDGEAAGDNFGINLALSADGQTVAIGARNNDGNGLASGQVRVFSYNSALSQWQQVGEDFYGDGSGDRLGGDWGTGVALSMDGRIMAAGAPYNDGNGSNAGNVRVFALL